MKKYKKGFTLIELIVAIALIWILAVAISSLNFNKISDNQRALIFTNDVFTPIEAVRNNSLLWKWVLNDLSTPTKTIIEMSTANSWSLNINYYSWSTLSRTENWLSFIPFSSISDLKCSNIDFSSSWSTNNVWIIFEWNNITFSNCMFDWTNTWAILDIKTKYKSLENTIRLNSVSGTIEKL